MAKILEEIILHIGRLSVLSDSSSSNFMTPRIQRLRERVLNWPAQKSLYIGQRIYGALEGLTNTLPSMSWGRIRARMLAYIVEKSAPIIVDDEILVGYNYDLDDRTFWTELNLTKYLGKNRDDFRNYLKRGVLTEEQIEFCLDVTDDMDHIIHHMQYAPDQPQAIQLAIQEGAIQGHGTSENHTILGFEQVLRKGFRGILHEIKELLSKVDWRDPHSAEKRVLLESAEEVAAAACNFGKKFADAARARLSEANSSEQRKDLERIIGVCEHVPELPASSFLEAVQSFWFAHIFSTWEDGINANSLGRLDQIFYPYYKADIEAGTLTEAQAFEILACLWIKLYRDYDVQQACIGGITVDGHDASNRLTYLMLEVTDQLDFIRCLSMRLHKGTPASLIERALKVVRKGQGIPFFFNDEVLVPALVSNGIPLQDARDYAAIGCVEICIPGKANPHAVSNWVNLLKCLELALNEGKSLTTQKQVGVKTPAPEKLQNMDMIIQAYKQQVEYCTDLACAESNRLEMQNMLRVPMVYKSILTEDCLKSGKDFNAGGARYHFHESMCFGVPNVADSLEAIHELVFETKKMTLHEMVQHMRTNFADETVRQLLLNRAAKYGNDQERVDQYANMVMEHFCRYLETQRSPLGGKYLAQPFTFLWLIDAGRKTAATPDGRHKGDNLAYSLSPMQGRDIQGLSAMINSLAKLPYTLAAGGPSAIIEVDPALFEGENLTKMVTIMQTAIEKGVGQMQFNVITAEILKAAQADPERYSSLSVRVSGFSQKFCLLERAIQDHIIARTKHQQI